MEWEDYEPHFKSLLSVSLASENVDDWLAGWSALADRLDEQYTRLYIATTQFTNAEDVKQRFNHFVESIQSQARAEDQKLKEKLLTSGLQPANFKMGLKKLRAEADIFKQANLGLLVEEQKLNAEHNRIRGTQTVIWEGRERTPSQMYALIVEKDPAIREKAWIAVAEARLKNREAINDLWQKLMVVRLKIADNAGLPDYRSYMWAQRFRFDYSPEDCKTFHQAIEEVVVPAVKKIYEKRRQKLGLETLRPWDLEVDTSTASPLKPYETVDELKSKTKDIFAKVDPKFGEYFQTMIDENLLDLDSRKHKAPGGYNLIYCVNKRPFIFMNNTGTHGDVATLLHEGGHAFHAFEAGVVPYFHERSENFIPAEFGEVAAKAMELLAFPYLTKEHGGFYTEAEAARACLEHLEGFINLWPHMAMVDTFQHWVYENPKDGSDPAACDRQWGELTDRFMPGVDFSGLEDAKKTGWQRIMHIHTIPFYYVEYGLSQLGAVQVWANALKDPQQAVANYRKALALGATVALPDLFQAAGANFSFDAQTLKTSVDLIEAQMETLEQVKE